MIFNSSKCLSTNVFIVYFQNVKFQAVTKLIAQGADVNRKSKDGMTPLCVASFWGYVDIVEYLLNHG